jgi:hypothetical protein
MKYDGIRAFAEMKNDECIAVRTYNMLELNLDVLDNIPGQLEVLAQTWRKHIVDDEYHIFFDFEITGKERQSVSGQVNTVLKGTAKKGIDKEWMANIFDIVPWKIFKSEGVTTYNSRRFILEGVYREAKETFSLPNIVIAERWGVSSFDELNTLFESVLEQGCEGLVVKKGSGVYELKRSLNWIKMKAEKECDLIVTGWFDGAKGTKREGKIGGFRCESREGLLQVSVGSGFTDKMIDEIVNSGQDSYIGKIVKVRYNAVISKKDSDIKSLFLPRFIQVRFDKNEADTLEMIIKK